MLAGDEHNHMQAMAEELEKTGRFGLLQQVRCVDNHREILYNIHKNYIGLILLFYKRRASWILKKMSNWYT